MASKTNYHCYQENSHLRSDKPQVKIFIFIFILGFFNFINFFFSNEKNCSKVQSYIIYKLRGSKVDDCKYNIFIFDISKCLRLVSPKLSPTVWPAVGKILIKHTGITWGFIEM